MEELLLIALGIYLLRGAPDYKSLPSGPELYDLILIANGRQGQPKGPDHLVCPWLWKNRPAIFNVVPINPKSRDNWKNLCDIWREIRFLGLEIEKNEALIPTKTRKKNKEELEKQIVDAKNRQAFLMKETKRIADIQKRTENLYQRSLQNTFSQNEIKDFYLTRKNEILQGIWPKNDTQVVPIVSPPGGGRDRKAVDRGPIDRGSDIQLSSKYHRAQLNKNPENYNQPWYKADAKRYAAEPGKRVSSTGNTYYEYRINRSDQPGKKI